MVELILKSMLKGRIEGEPADFLNGLVESEDEAADPKKVLDRIKFCLGRIVKLSERLAEEFEHIKLVMREFWTAA
jgi:hypothetical protein